MTTYRYSEQQRAAILAAADGPVFLPYRDMRTEESLVRRGLAEFTGFDRQHYTLTDAGKAAAASLRSQEGL